MNKFLYISIFAFMLGGCSTMLNDGFTYRGVTVARNKIAYESEKNVTTFSKMNDEPDGTQHYRGTFVSKNGMQIPGVTAGLVDIPDGKQIDVFIKQ